MFWGGAAATVGTRTVWNGDDGIPYTDGNKRVTPPSSPAAS